jgi:cardiolipin synthase
MRRYVDGEIAQSQAITLQSHGKDRTLVNRLRWAFSYFLVAVADYRISRRLNFPR